MSHLNIAFLVSGNGTLFETLTTACRSGILDAEPALLISSRKTAPALERAERLKVPFLVLKLKPNETLERFGERMLGELRDHKVNFVCLAGYLKLVPENVVREYAGRMLNIHPALLPAFGGSGMYGIRVHEAVLESGVRLTGATVHLVDEEFDHGPIVAQRAVPVHPDDTAESLAERVHAVEHPLYIDAVRFFCEDRIQISGRRVTIKPKIT